MDQQHQRLNELLHEDNRQCRNKVWPDMTSKPIPRTATECLGDDHEFLIEQLTSLSN